MFSQRMAVVLKQQGVNQTHIMCTQTEVLFDNIELLKYQTVVLIKHGS
jgi:hypothetical protein